MNVPMCVGLTGGIGSGKTTASDIFSSLGVPVIDADAIAHEVVESGQPALQSIAREFGPDVIGEDGQLRRNHLRSVIFNDDAARKRLEAILHPLIREEITRRIKRTEFPYCLISLPLLLEARASYNLDRVLVIDVPEELQLERASRRDKLRQADIRKIMDSQSSRQDRLAAADDVILNDRDIAFLKEQVEKLHHGYLETAGKRVVPCT